MGITLLITTNTEQSSTLNTMNLLLKLSLTAAMTTALPRIFRETKQVTELETRCATEYETKCSIIYEDRYYTEYETTYPRKCTQSYEEKCTTSSQECFATDDDHGDDGDDKPCKKVPVKCEQVPREHCIKVKEVKTTRGCDKIPIKHCQVVPIKNCENVPVKRKVF